MNELPTAPNNEAIEPAPLRVRCSKCFLEVGMPGRREDLQSLLEYHGWKLGANMLCPECVKETAREFMRQYHP